MSLFKKKWDLQNDSLRVVFDINEKRYITYYGSNLIPYDSLNRKSKKILDEKNNMLMTDNNLLEEEIRSAKSKLRYDKLKSMGYICNSFEVMGNIQGSMSKEMEEYLTKLVTEENVLLGIHRLGYVNSKEKIEDILINGLMIVGHLGGAASNSRLLENHVSYYSDNNKIIKELMYADLYKNSKGSILIRIPDSDLTRNIFIESVDGTTRLDPKYILGYVPLEPNHHIERIVCKEDIILPEKKYEASSVLNEFYTEQFDEQELEQSHYVRR